VRWALAVIAATGALALTACTDSQPNPRVAPENTVAPFGPVTSDPPTTRPVPDVAGAQQYIDTFVGMLSPRQMGVCPGLRARPDQSRHGHT
jgi:hypothetical protein